MSKNVILRMAWNRAEMLQVSIEHEMVAQEYHKFSDDLITLFVLDKGYTKDVMEVIKKYPYEYKVTTRNSHHGLTKNILLGLKEAFEMTSDYVCYVEDDICIHKTYFQYMDLLLNMDYVKVSVYSAYTPENGEEINEVFGTHRYAAWGSIIMKEFFEDYIAPCITPVYYKDYNSRSRFVVSLNNNYQEHWGDEGYKYGSRGDCHNEQAGLLNRLVDIAMIEEDKYVIMPDINRQMHIGFYGKNRPGKLPGKSFDERLVNLRFIVDNNKLYEMTKSKQYDDFHPFSPKLDDWNGTLYLSKDIIHWDK